MLHVATVHYASPRWIEIQTRHLREHIPVPFQTWTSLELIDPALGSHFDHVVEHRGRHSDKLNHLAIEISHAAAGDDLIMFIDGDAFPIADPMPLIEDGLGRAPLVAVRRAENMSDRQPHPCFCVTSVKTWRSLPGDWSAGYSWPDNNGKLVSDVGGNLLRQLELTGTPWVEVRRTNRVDLDPLFFGIYGDAIYHHGAGFRASDFSRVHLDSGPRALAIPRTPLLRWPVRRLNRLRRQRWEREVRDGLMAHAGSIVERIERGDPSWVEDLR
ncbi:MAG TPA: hypothetical protein VHT29_14705 [Solirubrobacteraceae bacterium]|jgi:hypothetical protein|nr:hypothetical protein [Solirubrobacteraceae bacterium]